MKNFILGMSLAIITSIFGLILVMNNLEKNVTEITQDCSWGEMKDCYSGSSHPNNPCCPPKFHMIEEPFL